jgi:hypothetical protein
MTGDKTSPSPTPNAAEKNAAINENTSSLITEPTVNLKSLL